MTKIYQELVAEFRIRERSGGKGRWCGGDGVVWRIRILEPMTAAILSGHRHVPPHGSNGGEPGQIGRNAAERADGRIEELPGTAQTTMRIGDAFVIETPGGGGISSTVADPRAAQFMRDFDRLRSAPSRRES